MEKGRIADAKYQVLGCPGAVSAAMVLADLVRGKTLSEALKVKDRDVFRRLVQIPDQKQHCIRLATDTEREIDLQRANPPGNDDQHGHSHGRVCPFHRPG